MKRIKIDCSTLLEEAAEIAGDGDRQTQRLIAQCAIKAVAEEIIRSGHFIAPLRVRFVDGAGNTIPDGPGVLEIDLPGVAGNEIASRHEKIVQFPRAAA